MFDTAGTSSAPPCCGKLGMSTSRNHLVTSTPCRIIKHGVCFRARSHDDRATNCAVFCLFDSKSLQVLTSSHSFCENFFLTSAGCVSACCRLDMCRRDAQCRVQRNLVRSLIICFDAEGTTSRTNSFSCLLLKCDIVIVFSRLFLRARSDVAQFPRDDPSFVFTIVDLQCRTWTKLERNDLCCYETDHSNSPTTRYKFLQSRHDLLFEEAVTLLAAARKHVSRSILNAQVDTFLNVLLSLIGTVWINTFKKRSSKYG